MKGQFVFEFLIAGIIFFTVVLYAMNFLNVNVSDFRGRFYTDKLQSKAMQISEILVNEKSPLSLAESPSMFNVSRIEIFNATYCNGDYTALRKDLDLIEKTDYGERMHNINITLTTYSGSPLLECGYTVPSGIEKVEIERIGVLNENKELVKLKIIVW